MKKDFSIWNEKKSGLHNNIQSRVFFHEREVWWCSLGVNIGYEQDGKGGNFARPVLIVKKFNKEIFWALPLTTQLKSGKYYFSLDIGDGVERRVILSQLRLIDAKRLRNKFAVVSKEQFSALKKALIALLQETPSSL